MTSSPSLSRAPQRGFAVEGPTGAGKSTAAKRYAEQFPPYRGADGYKKMSVLYVEIPNKPTDRKVVSAILYALGDPAYDSGTPFKRSMRVHDLLLSCGLHLIIFDEFQRVIDNANKNVPGDVAEFFESDF